MDVGRDLKACFWQQDSRGSGAGCTREAESSRAGNNCRSPLPLTFPPKTLVIAPANNRLISLPREEPVKNECLEASAHL